MVFSSLMFLFRFLPLALLAYFIAPRFMRNGVLLVISLLFYGWGEPKYILIMFVSIVVDYVASGGIERHRSSKAWMRFYLSLSVMTNMGLLLGFKYTNFFIENINALTGSNVSLMAITLPLGISFYTFQTMSYTLDVYYGRAHAESNIIDFGAYVCLFPQLIAGPIVKYVDVQHELKHRQIDLKQIDYGIRYFIMGLASKVLIANNVGLLWADVQAIGFDKVSTPLAWLGILAFAFQIYFDFSGYSMMAIGLGKILGFEFPKNFDFPYASRSITEFWRRWHMTLGSWFREYVYIPLGGNRHGLLRQLLNLAIVWFLTGFWHGASWNFIFWGLYFLVFLILEKMFLLTILNRFKGIAHVYTALVVLLSWVIFAITDMHDIGMYFSRLTALDMGSDALYAIQNYGFVLLLAFVFSGPWIKGLYEPLKERRVLVTTVLGVIFVLCVSYLVDSSFNPFLYFRF